MYDLGHSSRVSLGQLVDALQDVHVLQHANERGLLLELLRHKLGRHFDPGEYSSARLHLFSIVMACDRERGGLSALVDTIRELEPESLAVDQVVALVDSMSPL